MKANLNRIRKYMANGDETLRVSDSSVEDHVCDEILAGMRSDSDVNDEDDDDDEEVDAELADLLDHYLEQLENGTPTSVEQLVADHPQHEEPLREYLAGLHLLNAGIAEMVDSPFRLAEDCPQTLGDYELIHEIGRGGMGVVYEARQISLDRRVALKVLPFASMLDQRQIARFNTEARAAAGLQHPHIVPVHGVGCDQGVHFYAMQFIEGSSVRELIDSSKNSNAEITPREVARLGVQAASGLHTAHRCGVVHRDIKPSNLLLDTNNDLWIADFGLARNQSDNNLTMSGDVLGTLHYMSPEQIRGNSAIADPRSDVYALGVTLYELLTLRRPFRGESHHDVLEQIEQGHSKSVRTCNPDVPRDLENVIAKAMSVDPSHRYQSAAKLEADLNRFMEGRATLAKPPSVLQRLSCWASRNRSLVVSLFAVLLIAIVALACSTFWLSGQRSDLEDQKQVLDSRLNVTESTLETFGMETAERLKQIPGSEAARKALLGDLLAHYEELLSVTNNDPSMRSDRAITSTKIANIHRESGDLHEALHAYRHAEADFVSLLEGGAAAHKRSQAMELLAKCQSNMSVVLMESGNVDEAMETVSHAIKRQTEILEVDPSTTHAMDLAASYTNLSSVESHRGGTGLVGLKRAEELVVDARQQCTPDEEAELLVSLSTIYGRLSSQLRTSEIDNATSYADKAVECSKRLLALQSKSVSSECRQLHAVNCNNLASLFFKQNKSAQAIELYEEAALQLEEVAQSEGLVRTLVNLAKAQTEAGNSLASAESYGRAITVQSSLLLASPGDLNHVARLGGLHNNRALALQKLGKNAHACVAYESAIEYQERAYQLAPKDLPYYRDALSRTLFNTAKASMKAGRPHYAAEYQLRRSQLWPGDAKQLFSVARNIAAAVDRMQVKDPQRGQWANKAIKVLDAAVLHDMSHRLDRETVSKLKEYLWRNGGLQS